MTDRAPERFSDWLSSDIRPELSERGFTKTASTFHKRGPAGWGVVNFQKSQFGSRHETRFTINLGVSLDRLVAAEGGDPRKKLPAYRCLWQARIAEAVGDRSDRWWDLNRQTDLAKLTAEILPLLIDRGLPLIEERLTEDGFVASLTASQRVGHTWALTEAQILESLTSRGPTT